MTDDAVTDDAATDVERRLARVLGALEPIGRAPAGGGYRRFAYTSAESDLRAWFAGEAARRSLDLHEDRAGNLWAWWGDPSLGDAVVTGSHLDSVPNGGAFDGPLGVTSAFLALDVLRRRCLAPTRPIAITAFADEEGSRFGVACAGSRVLTGQLPAERALALTDDDGITYAEALTRSGRTPDRFGPDPEVARAIGVFVELHVEQGRGLADLQQPIALATAIRAHGRWRFDLPGRPDHAGTTRLEDRDDPMLRQARLVLAARESAQRHAALATVGKVLVEPNGVNAIASRVRVWLDARADDDPTVRNTVADVAAEMGLDPVEESWTPRVDLDRDLRRRLDVAITAGRSTDEALPALTTGAGHDAGILATAGVPTAMIFVRNPTGVSHAPDEHAELDDAAVGVLALADVLEDLACR